jgi:patatin-like phospholipase/acyl hydrolase
MTAIKLLSIDGGGIKGIFELTILNDIEKKYCVKNGKLIGDYFDVICGTSTGSIIALAIANKIPIQTILDTYLNNAELIFPNRNILQRITNKIKFWAGCKYDNKPLYNLVDNWFENKTMSDLNKLVYVSTYNITIGNHIVLKTPTKKLLEASNMTRLLDADMLIKDVVMASCSAPFYFQPYFINHYDIRRNGYYVDGGIFANNPTSTSIADLCRFYINNEEHKYNKISVLSIGCGNQDTSIKTKFPRFFWNFTKIRYFVDIIFNSNSNKDDYIIKYNPIVSEYVRIPNQNFKFEYKIDLDTTDKSIINYMNITGKNVIDNIFINKTENDRLSGFFQNQSTFNDFI